jgi:hypothetical protein
MKVGFDFLKREESYPFAIVFFGLLYYLSYVNYGISGDGEGLLVYGAQRVLQGHLPLVDFISYTPGSYFLLALLFKMFGPNLLVSRYLEIFFLLLNGLMIFFIGKRLMSPRFALLPSFLYIVIPGPWQKVFFTFGLLLPLVSLLGFLEKRGKLRTITVGWAVGISIIFKLESGLYSFITVVAVLFIASLSQGAYFPFKRKPLVGFVKELILFCFAVVSFLIPFVIYYSLKSPITRTLIELKSMYEVSGILGTMEVYGGPSLRQALGTFSLGRLEHLFFYLIVLLYIYALGRVVRHFLATKSESFPLILPVLIMGILALSYVYVGFEKGHLLNSATPAYILFGFVFHSVAKGKTKGKPILCVALILISGLFFLECMKWKNTFLSGSISRLYEIRKDGARLLPSERAKVYVTKKQFDGLYGLIQYFEDKKGYLMPLGFEPGINFLTSLENPTRFLILAPGYLRNPMLQMRVIDEIERYRVGYLLVKKRFWEGKGSLRKFAPALWELVAKHYELEKEIGDHLIFSRYSFQ